MTSDQAEALARTRYFIMTFARIAGALMVFFGIVVTAGRFENIPPLIGYVLVVVGLVDIVLVPRALARRWRTPPAQ
ncbi:hypothetical protein [Sphingomonas cavernae]|uniref:Uncharacterized protein n=1 Tax=Sphingomonas cavernae TaxID=2320861 RepID=A0A418WRN4_9SPHN|nr:hypothetical protein [Sphingomonas cavernae]RJF93913.1 hypothetical protein D3876_06455 [Sphingomonas cavernae]